MKKKTSPILWVAIAGVAIAIFVLTEPKKAPIKTKPRTSIVNIKRSQAGITEEDYTATFLPVNQQARNAFMPLVVRNEGQLLPNTLPNSLTGGANWVYTGTAEVDGVPTALLENRSTGESVFLRHGERWKGLSVTSIAPETVVFSGGMGVTYTLRLINDETSTLETDSGTMPAQIGNAPQISGQIGAGLTAVPEGSVEMAVPGGGGATIGNAAPAAVAPGRPQGGNNARRNNNGRRNNANQTTRPAAGAATTTTTTATVTDSPPSMPTPKSESDQ